MNSVLDVCSLLLPLVLGVCILWAADAAAASQLTEPRRSLRRGLHVLGWAVLVLGLVPVTAQFNRVLTTMLVHGVDVEELPGLIAGVVLLMVLGLIPLGAGLLVGVAGLVGVERTPRQQQFLRLRLRWLQAIGWCAIVFGVLFTCAGVSLVMLILLVAAGACVLWSRRSEARDGLLWMLAITASKGMPLAPAVAAYAEQRRGRFRSELVDLAQMLSAGESLPDAIDRLPQLLSADARVAARIGWECGALGRALRDAAARRTLHRPIWQVALGRLAYLVAVVLILQSISGFLLYFIVPKFKKIFMDFGLRLPEATERVLGLSDWFVDRAGLVPLAAIVALLLYLPYSFMVWGSWVPFWHRLLMRRHTAVILRALALSVEAGRPMLVTLRQLTGAHPVPWLRLRLEHAAERMDEGEAWVASLRAERLIARVDVPVLEAAERAGNLAWCLREIADRSERQLGYRLHALAQILFPIVVVSMGVLVFLFAAGYFSPLVKLIEELSG